MPIDIDGQEGSAVAQVSITISFDSAKAKKTARGLNTNRWDATDPEPVGQEVLDFIKDELIEKMKIGFRRGDRAEYADGFVPEDDIEPAK